MTEWHGNHNAGVEVRRNKDGSVDEIMLWVGGKAVSHMEQMNDNGWWIGLQPPNKDVLHVDIVGKSKVSVTTEFR